MNKILFIIVIGTVFFSYSKDDIIPGMVQFNVDRFHQDIEEILFPDDLGDRCPTPDLPDPVKE